VPGDDGAEPIAVAALGALALLVVLRRRRSLAVGALLVTGVLAASSTALAEPPATTADALALNERASQKILQGEFPQGLALIQRALRIEPDNDAFLVNAAGLMARANDHKASRAYYVQAIEQALSVEAHHRAQSYEEMLMQLAETENGALMAASAKSASVTTDSDTKGAIDVDAQVNQAQTSLQQGDYPSAAAAATSAEALCRQVLPRDVVRQARAHSLVGLALASSGHAEGLPMLESAITTMSEAVGKDHPEVLILRASLANALLYLGKNPEAISVLEAVVADSAKRFGKDSAFELKSRANLVILYSKAGRPRDAIALGQLTLEPCRRELGAHSAFCLHLMSGIAIGQYQAGNMPAARETATRALAEQIRTTGVGGSNVLTPSHYPAAPVDPAVDELLNLLVGIDLGPGAHDAVQTMRSRAKVYARALGQDDLATVRVDVVVAQLDLRSTKPEVGARKLVDLHHRVDTVYGAYSPVALDLAALAAGGLLAAGKAEEAEPLAVETSRRVRLVMGAGSEQGITALFTEGMVKVRLHRPDGVALVQEAAARSAALGPANPLAAQLQQAAAALAATPH
jgi:MYXO-CTERM domain-containing protein